MSALGLKRTLGDQRHREGEAGFVLGGADVHRPAMRFRYLIDDEQTEPEALLALADRAPEEWLKQLLARFLRDRRTPVADGYGE